jgi:hypothetical protein
MLNATLKLQKNTLDKKGRTEASSITKNLWEDESGIAYSLMMIVFFIALASITYMYLTPFVNSAAQQYDTLIVSKGIVSEMTIDTLNFNLVILKAIPFFVAFFGVFVFGIVRSLYLKRTGGGD